MEDNVTSVDTLDPNEEFVLVSDSELGKEDIPGHIIMDEVSRARLKRKFKIIGEKAWRKGEGKNPIAPNRDGMAEKGKDRADFFKPVYGRCPAPVPDKNGNYSNRSPRCTFVIPSPGPKPEPPKRPKTPAEVDSNADNEVKDLYKNEVHHYNAEVIEYKEAYKEYEYKIKLWEKVNKDRDKWRKLYDEVKNNAQDRNHTDRIFLNVGFEQFIAMTHMDLANHYDFFEHKFGTKERLKNGEVGTRPPFIEGMSWPTWKRK